jgi:hypothetical protein
MLDGITDETCRPKANMFEDVLMDILRVIFENSNTKNESFEETGEELHETNVGWNYRRDLSA